MDPKLARYSSLVLSHTDPLPHPPRRVLIAGTSGVGKTTLARRLAALWNIPHTELDALHHGPHWTPRPTFAAEARELAAGDEWVTEWAYWSKGMKTVLGERADTLIWLNFSRPMAFQRLLRRTLKRQILRERLWHGNVEPPLYTFFTNPEENILRWGMRTHGKWIERMPTVDREFPHLSIIELRTPREVRRWLTGPATDLSPGSAR